MDKQDRSIPTPTLIRLSQYFNYLGPLYEGGEERVSAPMIAKVMNLTEIQVRKDLAAISSSGGQPRKGFCVPELYLSIGKYLGYFVIKEAVLAGAGHLGSALTSYTGFRQYGIRIIAAFDSARDVIGTTIDAKPVIDIREMTDFIRENKIQIGIITVPARAAQSVCDQMIKGGVRAIWNFAPTSLVASEDVFVHNENMAASLALLANHIEKMKQ